MNDLTRLTARAIAKGVRNQTFSAREVVAAFLGRIGEGDGEIGAFLSVREVEAEREAAAIDRLVSTGNPPGPLTGVPVALKDNMLVRGGPVTAGSKILEHYRGSYDATVVEKLRAAGAIVIGKTNLDEFAMGSSTEHSAFQRTRNPHDLECVPGGSSGGSAAAVAARLAPLALGSDTSGSITLPAAFCGVVGLRPTYGSVSRFGLIAMASSLDQIGPFARTVRDAALLFSVIAGEDPRDATSVSTGAPYAPDVRMEDSQPSVIGMPREFDVPGIDPAVSAGLAAARERFERMGHRIVSISLPHASHALAVYYVLMPAEAATNLARFDGIRYPGLPALATAATLRDLYEGTRGAGFGPEPRRRILLGTFVLSAGHYDAYYAKAELVRELIRDDFERAFDPSGGGVDLILAPVSPTTAFRFGEKLNDPLAMYLSDVFTTQMNLAGLPALSVPVRQYEPGSGELPVGFQLIGPKFSEDRLFGVAARYEDSLGTS